MELTCDTPVRYLPRVGPAMAARLARLDIETAEDLLYHIPFRYDDFSLVSPIAAVQPGETVTIRGVVESMKNFYTKTGKKIQEAVISDTSGRLTAVWFNQPYLLNVIRPGNTLHLSGTISWFGHTLVLSNPQYENVSGEQGSRLHTGRIVPVYPETEGVSSKWLRGRIAFLLDAMLPSIHDTLPRSIAQDYSLGDLHWALRSVHFPNSLAEAENARRRLAFEELFMLQLRAHNEKRIRQTRERSTVITIPNEDIAGLVASLPFRLTNDQKTAVDEILNDIGQPIPMNRLLVGDVGSGKTVVATLAIYAAYRNGLDAVLMAPTQILAEQHFTTIHALLSPRGIPVHLVTGNKKTLPRTRRGSSIIVGTHALLSASLAFHRLGLVVVDEQHRFGVKQRATLLKPNKEGLIPHLLTMTATPIPRTLAKTIFGAIDLSSLADMPPGRAQVKTWVVPSMKREKAYAWIQTTLRETNAQAFVICPLVEESQHRSEVKAVTQEFKCIKHRFPDISIGLLHGRLTPKEKTAVLADFRNNKHTILVSTPVVEVGIDIPNATIMIIEGADCFGLGQLHQLRGRVGRGTLASYCLLFTEQEDKRILDRLKILETTHSGPLLAEADLRLRGPGELFGTRQHGIPYLKVAAFTDMQTIEQAHGAVERLTKDDPDLTAFPLLREAVKRYTIADRRTQD